MNDEIRAALDSFLDPTEGTWEATVNGTVLSHFEEGSVPVAYHSQDPAYSNAQRYANARVMAAAPAMREALLFIVGTIEGFPHLKEDHELAEAYKACEDAIDLGQTMRGDWERAAEGIMDTPKP